MKSLQDFSLIRTHVESYFDGETVKEYSVAFYFFVCDVLLGLNENEVDECITDNYYLQLQKEGKQGHDLGIDVVYIDNSGSTPTIHLFNCKYTDKFEKTENHFPGNEIDKVTSFFQHLVLKNKTIKGQINPVLYAKMEEIWDIYDRCSPKFILHFCSNLYNEFEVNEGNRLKTQLNAFSNISIEHNTIQSFVDRLLLKSIKSINAKIKGIDKHLFEKSDGDVRALVVNVDIRDLLKMVNSDKEFRENPNVNDYTKLVTNPICEDAFENNVRIYLEDKSKIKQTIKATAHSDDRFHFFYYNNGITITCKKFEYPKLVRSPVIELTDLQVVNGSQTIHSLYEAFVEDPSKFDELDILCRIYETNSIVLSQNISEYTNSQNPVKSRDVRSNDFFQKKLEVEMKAMGYFYERKKDQHSKENRKLRIDAEIIGQLLYAFNNGEPGSAKDNKKEVFGDCYETIFNDDVTANLCLTVFGIYNHIENKRKEFRKELLRDYENNTHREYIFHASLYLMYMIRLLANSKKIPISLDKLPELKSLYSEAVSIIKKTVEKENKTKFLNYRVYFKGNRLKKYIETTLDELGILHEKIA